MTRQDPLTPTSPHTRAQTGLNSAHRTLIVVDSVPAAEAIAGWLPAQGGSITVADAVLLSVVVPPETTRTLGIFAETVHRHLLEAGQTQMIRVREVLDDIGARYEVRVEFIDDAETVDRIAQEMQCSLIVMAAALPSSPRRHWLSATGFGMPSLATRVAEISECPTLIVKHRSQ